MIIQNLAYKSISGFLWVADNYSPRYIGKILYSKIHRVENTKTTYCNFMSIWYCYKETGLINSVHNKLVIYVQGVPHHIRSSIGLN